MEVVFLSIREYCRLYSIGRTRAYELIASGDLVKAKVGARSYITLESAKAFAERSIIRERIDVAS